MRNWTQALFTHACGIILAWAVVSVLAGALQLF
jgi:hypothetical protein